MAHDECEQISNGYRPRALHEMDFGSDDFGWMIHKRAKVRGTAGGEIGRIASWIFVPGSGVSDLIDRGYVILKMWIERLKVSCVNYRQSAT
jgi:hypothetical protein